MSGLTVAVSAFMLALVVGTLTWGGPAVVFAIPVALIGIGASMFVDFKRKRQGSEPLQNQVDNAREDDVHFTDRDRQTLYSE